VRDEEVRHAASFDCIPELVVLGSGNAEDAGNALASQCGGRRLRAGHFSLDALAPGEAAELDATLGAGRKRRNSSRSRAYRATRDKELTPV
jgi:hypothetical protein